MPIRSVEELNVAGRRLFLRVDFNVPYDSTGQILDDTRIQESLPTIRYLLEKNARLIIASHLGRPKERDPRQSLLVVGEHLSHLLDREVLFPEDCVGDAVKKLGHDLKEGQVLLLENLRFHPEEEQNDPVFSKQLAALADLYVTDAFGTLHRAHASTVGVPSLVPEKGIGFLVAKELEILKRLLTKPERPFWAVLGGAKVADKIGVIENLLGKVDGMILGGALAYTFLKARGDAVGLSCCEEDKIHLARKIMKKAEEKKIKLYLPIDHRVVTRIEDEKCDIVSQIPPDGIGVDIGPRTIALYSEVLTKAGTIFWNGPMGIFERPPFAEGTHALVRSIARPGVTTVVGGGESVTACRQAGVAGQITHLSTGGGASLEYLEGRTLPGLKVLEGNL